MNWVAAGTPKSVHDVPPIRLYSFRSCAGSKTCDGPQFCAMPVVPCAQATMRPTAGGHGSRRSDHQRGGQRLLAPAHRRRHRQCARPRRRGFAWSTRFLRHHRAQRLLGSRARQVPGRRAAAPPPPPARSSCAAQKPGAPETDVMAAYTTWVDRTQSLRHPSIIRSRSAFCHAHSRDPWARAGGSAARTQCRIKPRVKGARTRLRTHLIKLERAYLPRCVIGT